ncbi:MAG TPA: hypothetical protein VF282_10675, partial [Bacillota bacterium]
MLALAVPLAWPSGAAGQHLDLPSAASVRSGVVRLADFVSGQGTPAQPGQGGQPGSAAGGKRVGPPTASQGRAHAQGRPLFSVPGTVPAYRVHGPSVKQFTTGPEAGGTGSSYDAATSVLVQAGTNATASLYQNADGTYTERLYGSPTNAKDAGGSWAPAGPGGAANGASSGSLNDAAGGAGNGANGSGGAQGAGSGLLPVGYDGSGQSTAVLGLPGAGKAGVPAGFHVTAASLHLFDMAAAQCSAESTVSVYAVSGQVTPGSAASYKGQGGPGTGAKLGSWTGTAPEAACGSGEGDWISVPFNAAGIAA